MKALILAGGSGTRFWPLSRRRRPKQLLALDGDRSLLQATFERLQPLLDPAEVWVCTTHHLAAEVRRQLSSVPPAQVLEEPVGRNTAAAIGWTVASMAETERQDVVVVLPADHRMADGASFRRAVTQAAEVARGVDRVLALGVEPRWPESGYGYLELGEQLPGGDGLFRVRRFTEKPDRATAEQFLRTGRYLWNAGIFVFRGSTLLQLLRRHQPELAAGLDAVVAAPALLDQVYGRLPDLSIDHGLMEKLQDLVAIRLDCGWSDLGSWAALAEVLADREGDNTTRGDVVALDTSDSFLWAEDGTIAALGVRGLVVVRTGDAVLVVPKERSQEVRALVENLRREGRDELL